MQQQQQKTSPAPAQQPAAPAKVSMRLGPSNAEKQALLDSGELDPLLDGLADLTGSVEMGVESWKRAAGTVAPPADPEGFDEAAVETKVALDTANQLLVQIEADSLALEGDAFSIAADRWAQAEATVSMLALDMERDWDSVLDQTQLGPSYGSGGARDAASLLVWVQRNTARLPEVLAAEVEIAQGVAELPEDIGFSEMFSPGMRRIVAAFSGYYGHEWLYLYHAMMAEGAPIWALGAMASDIGAANYEADLQDQGGLVVDMRKIENLAQRIKTGIVRHGTDEDKVWDALRNLSRPEIQALRAHYAERYDRDLDDDIDGDFSGEELDRTEAGMVGDPVTAALAAVEDEMDYEVCVPSRILDVLFNVPASQVPRLVEAFRKDPKAAHLRERVLSARYYDSDGMQLDDDRHDRQMLAAAFAGNFARAEAWRMNDKLTQETFVDSTGQLLGYVRRFRASDGDLLEQLEESKNPAALAAEYDAAAASLGNPSLRAVLAERLDGADRDLALALLDGDEARAQAARIRRSGKKEILRLLEDPGLEGGDEETQRRARERRAAMLDAFRDQYGEEDGDLEAFLTKKFKDEEDRAMALELMRDGQNDRSTILAAAIDAEKSDLPAQYGNVWGQQSFLIDGAILDVNIGLAKKALEGASKAEVEQLAAEYEARTGRNLYTDLDKGTAMEGDDHFEVKLLLEGAAETPEQILEQARERHDHYRGGWGASIVGGLEGLVTGSDTAAQADRQYAALRALYDEDGHLKAGVDPVAVQTAFRWYKAGIDDYKAMRDLVVEALAGGLEVLVAGLVTVLSGGAAAPWLVGVISGLVGTAAYVGTKYALLGPSYATKTMSADIIKGVVSAAVQGAVVAKFAGKVEDVHDATRVLQVLTEDAAALGDDFAKKVLHEVVKEAVSGASGSVVQTAFSEETWQKGLDDGFATMLADALKAAGISAVTSGAVNLGVKGGNVDAGEWYHKLGAFATETGIDAATGMPEEELGMAAWLTKKTISGANAVLGHYADKHRAAKKEEEARKGAAPEAGARAQAESAASGGPRKTMALQVPEEWSRLDAKDIVAKVAAAHGFDGDPRAVATELRRAATTGEYDGVKLDTGTRDALLQRANAVSRGAAAQEARRREAAAAPAPEQATPHYAQALQALQVEAPQQGGPRKTMPLPAVQPEGQQGGPRKTMPLPAVQEEGPQGGRRRTMPLPAVQEEAPAQGGKRRTMPLPAVGAPEAAPAHAQQAPAHAPQKKGRLGRFWSWMKGEAEPGQRVKAKQGDGLYKSRGGTQFVQVDLENDVALRKQLDRAHEAAAAGGDLAEKIALATAHVHQGVRYDEARQEGMYAANRGMVKLGDMIANNAAVCREKAMFMHVVLAEMGIESTYTTGNVQAGGGQGGHAWVELSDGTVIDGTWGRVFAPGTYPVVSRLQQQQFAQPRREVATPAVHDAVKKASEVLRNPVALDRLRQAGPASGAEGLIRPGMRVDVPGGGQATIERAERHEVWIRDASGQVRMLHRDEVLAANGMRR